MEIDDAIVCIVLHIIWVYPSLWCTFGDEENECILIQDQKRKPIVLSTYSRICPFIPALVPPYVSIQMVYLWTAQCKWPCIYWSLSRQYDFDSLHLMIIIKWSQVGGNSWKENWQTTWEIFTQVLFPSGEVLTRRQDGKHYRFFSDPLHDNGRDAWLDLSCVVPRGHTATSLVGWWMSQIPIVGFLIVAIREEIAYFSLYIVESCEFFYKTYIGPIESTAPVVLLYTEVIVVVCSCNLIYTSSRYEIKSPFCLWLYAPRYRL